MPPVLTMHRVKTILSAHQETLTVVCNNTAGAITCLGGGKYLAGKQETALSGPTGHETDLKSQYVRSFYSTDDGVTWSEQPEFQVHNHADNLIQQPFVMSNEVGPFFPLGGNALLSIGGDGALADNVTWGGGLYYSPDHGLSWTPALSSTMRALLRNTVGPTSVMSPVALSQLLGNTVWALGEWSIAADPARTTSYQLLKSVDGGKTFTDQAIMDASVFFTSIGALIDFRKGRLVATDPSATLRTIDGGSSWAPVPGFAVVRHPAMTAKVNENVAYGVCFDGTSFRIVKKTTDAGATWTQIGTIGTTFACIDIKLAVPDGSVLVASGVNNGSPSVVQWWFSYDSGVTWTQATYADSPVSGSEDMLPVQTTISDVGSVLTAVVNRLAAGVYTANLFRMEIWRGVWTGLGGAGGECGQSTGGIVPRTPNPGAGIIPSTSTATACVPLLETPCPDPDMIPRIDAQDEVVILGTEGTDNDGQVEILSHLREFAATGLQVENRGAVNFAISGMDVHPITGLLYGITSAGDPTQPASLIRINLTTGAGTLIGSLGYVPAADHAIRDITFASDGTLYGLLLDEPTGEASLCQINLTTGAATVIHTSIIGGITHSGALACDSADVIWAAPNGSDGHLWTYNRVTGVATDTGVVLQDVAAGFPADCYVWAMKWHPVQRRLYANVKDFVSLVDYLTTINTVDGTFARVPFSVPNMSAVCFNVEEKPIPPPPVPQPPPPFPPPSPPPPDPTPPPIPAPGAGPVTQFIWRMPSSGGPPGMSVTLLAANSSGQPVNGYSALLDVFLVSNPNATMGATFANFADGQATFTVNIVASGNVNGLHLIVADPIAGQSPSFNWIVDGGTPSPGGSVPVGFFRIKMGEGRTCDGRGARFVPFIIPTFEASCGPERISIGAQISDGLPQLDFTGTVRLDDLELNAHIVALYDDNMVLMPGNVTTAFEGGGWQGWISFAPNPPSLTEQSVAVQGFSVSGVDGTASGQTQTPPIWLFNE